jgi:adenylate kinase/nucleoside 2-deoxyribosyltransferase
MQKWIATGVSGSGRIELLQDLKAAMESRGVRVAVHDVGALMRSEATRLRIPIVDDRVLDIDRPLLRALRASALKAAEIEVLRTPNVAVHLVGLHATFRWKNRLIPGISYQELVDFKPDGFLSVVRTVDKICETNKANHKWDDLTRPDLQETQEWMIEEEFVTEVLADVSQAPMFLVSREHHIHNLADLLLTNKKKIYLSYPITAVRESNPELLAQVQGPILERLEELFVVFNPLAVQDMRLAGESDLPDYIGEVTAKAKDIIKARTIERDFQFIDQADAVVVFYLTDKVSPGVLAEIYYAHRNQKPVFVVSAGARSPFLEDVAQVLEPTVDALLPHLETFARDRAT